MKQVVGSTFDLLKLWRKEKETNNTKKIGNYSSLCTRVLQAKACRQKEDNASDATKSKPSNGGFAGIERK
jgi:hypothetical protein